MLTKLVRTAMPLGLVIGLGCATPDGQVGSPIVVPASQHLAPSLAEPALACASRTAAPLQALARRIAALSASGGEDAWTAWELAVLASLPREDVVGIVAEPVPDPVEMLVQCLQTRVAPGAWSERVDPTCWSIHARGGQLVVRSAPGAHAEIRRLLDRLRTDENGRPRDLDGDRPHLDLTPLGELEVAWVDPWVAPDVRLYDVRDLVLLVREPRPQLPGNATLERLRARSLGLWSSDRPAARELARAVLAYHAAANAERAVASSQSPQ